MIIDKYVNIQYKPNCSDFNYCDCYGLVKLIYKEEFGIELFEQSYTKLDYDDFYNNYKNNFVEVLDKDYKFGDVILFYNYHTALFLDNNKFIHIKENSNAQVIRLDNILYKLREYKVYRHIKEA